MKIYSISAKVHDKLGIIYRRFGNLKLFYGGKVFFSLSAYHFSRAYLLYLKQGDREGALKAYEGLKATKTKELEQTLFEKLYPEFKQKKSDPSK